MDYEIIRSNRKSLSIKVKDGKVIINAPLQMSKSEIDGIIRKHKAKIEEMLKHSNEISDEARRDPLSAEDIQKLADEALKYIPDRAEYYAKIMGVKYAHITIRNQLTRWGSCSSKNNLNFNCLLMLMPKEVIDSVIVHELCHLRHMNHSKAFYEEVYKYCPNYDEYSKWLKKNGKQILERMKVGMKN